MRQGSGLPRARELDERRESRRHQGHCVWQKQIFFVLKRSRLKLLAVREPRAWHARIMNVHDGTPLQLLHEPGIAVRGIVHDGIVLEYGHLPRLPRNETEEFRNQGLVRPARSEFSPEPGEI